MKYLPQLTEDELRYICSQINHQHAISYFTKHPKEFNKIRPGFRPNKLSKREVYSLLLNNHKRSFISTFIEQHIQYLLEHIEDQINEHLKQGESKETAFLRVLPYSDFAENIRLYFKLVNEDVQEEFIKIYNSLAKIIKSLSDKQVVLEEEINQLKEEIRLIKLDFSNKLSVYSEIEDGVTKLMSEVNTMKHIFASHEQTLLSVKNDRSQIDKLLKVTAKINKNIDLISTEVEKIKEFSQNLEQLAMTRNEPDEIQHVEELHDQTVPLYPCDIDEFKELLSLNLENVGVSRNTEYFQLLILHLSAVLFQGMPIIVSHKVGINLMKCVANTLIAKPNVKVLTFEHQITSKQVSDFLKSSDRVVGLINFLGNFNETELIPIIEKHRDKIIFLTVAYNRTLNYVSKEFLKYCRYINLERIGALSSYTNLTEDPSEIELQPRNQGIIAEGNRYQRIFIQIMEELNFSQSLIEQYGSLIKNENDLCCLLLFEILPYCTDVLQIKPYNISNQLIKYAGHEGRCPYKNLMIRWFA
jgi:cell division protein FtsB